MPDPTVATTQLASFLSSHAFDLLLIGILALVVMRGLKPWIHKILVRVMHAQSKTISGEAVDRLETDRRVATVEDLINKLLRALVAAGILAIVLGIFNLWSLVAGLGLVLAALTLAGQSIILDYLMGILILVEGQYFKGDTVLLGTVEGVVEEVGIRRTVIRDVRGTVHSISNGTIRQSANLTRTYGQATVEIDGVADRDVETVIEVLNEVGVAIAADPEFEGMFLTVPAYAGTTRLSSSGATLRISGRVRPEVRSRIEQELRRRVAASMAARGVELIRPGTYQRP